MRNYIDYFRIGQKIRSYEITRIGSLCLETKQTNGKLVPVFYDAITDWIKVIESLMRTNPDTDPTKYQARFLRNKVNAVSMYSAHLHAWESHYRAFALHVMQAEGK